MWEIAGGILLGAILVVLLILFWPVLVGVALGGIIALVLFGLNAEPALALGAGVFVFLVCTGGLYSSMANG